MAPSDLKFSTHDYRANTDFESFAQLVADTCRSIAVATKTGMAPAETACALVRDRIIASSDVLSVSMQAALPKGLRLAVLGCIVREDYNSKTGGSKFRLQGCVSRGRC